VAFALRAYRLEDFQTLWEIDQSCFTPEIAYSQFELKFYIRRPQSFTVVAEEIAEQGTANNKSGPVSEAPDPCEILGFLVGDLAPRGRGHIITIDVRERGRRQGVGSALLHAAETRFQEKNCPSIRLETAVNNIGALSFYKRRGYSVVRTVPRYYSNGLDALVLEKVLVKSGAQHLH
jgi:[ribosomal protein S18]-alanine N-acetyltransferase